eukprot:gnl/MRDRNA2_/MRDRNA2_94316_c0_seq1.p1 gnl/MRDRNA2_/MRDRNA2_94316_c0~~gnl/MRDRNA2_/MRDRNA2_94316_c0_seq1.p1  ORF type:complete len:191 (+),score=30.67 gnl/MRDRNA2_/MRDRNA2_94316_c0_seq1:126-698(+)
MGQALGVCTRLSDNAGTCRPKAACIRSCPQGLSDQQVSDILLVQSTLRGDVDDVKRAIQMGANIETTSAINLKIGETYASDQANAQTPLILACQMGHQDVAELLVQKKAYLLAMDDKGWIPLCYAFAGGHLEIVKLLTLPDNCQTQLKFNRQQKIISDRRNQILSAMPQEKHFQKDMQEEIDTFLSLDAI